MWEVITEKRDERVGKRRYNQRSEQKNITTFLERSKGESIQGFLW